MTVARAIPTPPRLLRDRLAETILAALHNAGARRMLAALGRGETAGWLPPADARWSGLVVERARRASAALAARPLAAKETDLSRALAAAAVLFDAGLAFEVHELLEPHWAAAEGEVRDVLQGLIQVAVGWQHLADGNVAGARALLEEGAARLAGRRLLGMDLTGFARSAASAAERLGRSRDATESEIIGGPDVAPDTPNARRAHGEPGPAATPFTGAEGPAPAPFPALAPRG